MRNMITISFPDRETEKRARDFLVAGFSDCVLTTGEHIVPEAALAALASEDISFTVRGKTTEEQESQAIINGDPDHTESEGFSDSEPENCSLFTCFLRGMGSVLEIVPPIERLDRWRMSQTVPLEEWPTILRAQFPELTEDHASKPVETS